MKLLCGLQIAEVQTPGRPKKRLSWKGMTFSPSKFNSRLPHNTLLPGLVVFCLTAITLVCAQNETTSRVFKGLVTDSTGAVIANAHVTARKMDSSLETSATTDKAGRFKLEVRRPGRYKVRVEAEGFQIAETVMAVGMDNSEPVTIVLPVK